MQLRICLAWFQGSGLKLVITLLAQPGSASEMAVVFLKYYVFSSSHFLFVCFLGLHPRHMEVSRLGVQSELQLLAYATATATLDPSYVCDLHHSSRQCWILNPLSKARDWTCYLMVPRWICFCSVMTGTPSHLRAVQSKIFTTTFNEVVRAMLQDLIMIQLLKSHQGIREKHCWDSYVHFPKVHRQDNKITIFSLN